MEYKEKFKQLPQSFKTIFSSPEFMNKVHELEVKFDITLSKIIMRLITDDLPMHDLAEFLKKEKHLEQHEATKLKVLIFQKIINPLNDELKKYPKEASTTVIDESVLPVPIQPKRKILDLKDIFEADGDNLASSESVPVEIQEWKDEMAQMRAKEKEYKKRVIEKILENITVDIPQELQKKMSDIISSRIKNIRDAVDTRLALSRPVDAGGLGLTGNDASEVSIIIEKQLKGIDLLTPAKKEIGKKLVKENSITKPEPAKVRAPVLSQQEVVDTPKQASNKEPFITAKKSEPENFQKPFIDPLPQEKEPFQTTPPIISGIAEKKKAGLIGPIEELAQITIEDWRSLYKTPKEAVEDVKAKLKVLKKNSFSQMIKGVAAWKKGNIVRLYIDMGARSAKNNTSIQESAEEQKSKGASYLTQDEFHAIMDLNRDLRTYQL